MRLIGLIGLVDVHDFNILRHYMFLVAGGCLGIYDINSNTEKDTIGFKQKNK